MWFYWQHTYSTLLGGSDPRGLGMGNLNYGDPDSPAGSARGKCQGAGIVALLLNVIALPVLAVNLIFVRRAAAAAACSRWACSLLPPRPPAARYPFRRVASIHLTAALTQCSGQCPRTPAAHFRALCGLVLVSLSPGHPPRDVPAPSLPIQVHESRPLAMGRS